MVKTEFVNVKQSLKDIVFNLEHIKCQLKKIQSAKGETPKVTYQLDEVQELLKIIPVRSKEDIQVLESLLTERDNYDNLVK